jgi:hypothetical protein
MISSGRVLRWFTIFLSVALVANGFGPFATDVLAKGRSFPIGVTGTILNVDRTNCECTLRVDEPARVLRMGLRRDCKFLKSGAPAKMGMLRKGAYVKVSYFATIFTGNLAVEIELNPKPEIETGIIEEIDIPHRRLILAVGPNSRHLALRWARNATFIKAGKPASAAALRVGSTARVAYYAPSFASKYAVRIDFK